MSFWGIEVKPGKPHPYHSDDVQGRLCITQATLGLGESKERTVLQCSVGHKSPVFLCSLLPNKVESCSLNLEFKDELVAFSVIGPRSVHLCGYFVSDDGDNIGDEYDQGFDSGEEFDASEEASDDDDSDEFDYGDDEFPSDDDGLGMFPPSPVPNSGVVIEEITDEDKAETEQMKKKKKTSDLQAQRQIVPKSNAGASVFESEDEDGFPISSSHKSNVKDQEPQADTGGKKGKVDAEKKKKQLGENSDAGKKRKMKKADQDSQPERKTKKKQKEKLEEVNDHIKDESQPEVEKMQDTAEENVPDQRGQDKDTDSVPKETSSEKKKKNKKKKKRQDVEGKSVDQAKSVVEDKAKSSVEADERESESSNVRTFSNGLVIEELEMGKPDGKKANPGSQVSVKYIGKLKKNGKIFDSCIGKAPFKFRLGVGAVIKGWDVGVAGMRVGDKRRLTIPPSMGYGEKGAGGVIPPNAWLMFDVELVNVR